MGISKSALLAVLLTIIARTTCIQPFKAEHVSSGLITESNEVFGSALYEAIKSVKGNLVLSPLSTQAILTMAWLGANGTTARQLESAVSLIREGQRFFVLAFKNLLEDLRNTTTVTFDIANKLYLQLKKDMPVGESFQQAMRVGFQSEVKQVDFANKLEEARTEINEWVQENTHGQISDLICEGTLRESTVLIAVNAVYFKGGWAKPFDEHQTTTQPFHVSESKTINVPMMHKKEYVMYAINPELGYQAIIMKYQGTIDDPTGDDETTGMLVLLPYEINGLRYIENHVTGGDLSQILGNMSYCEVNISIPRFNIESSLNLISALNKLGITQLFKEGADLSGISSGCIFINNIFQKTVVEVTEKGKEAEAPATCTTDAVPVMGTPPVFTADHPFMFMIMNSFHHVNLLIGRVVEPN